MVGVRGQMEDLINRRKGIYHRLHRCRDDGQREGYKADIAALSKQLVALRREVRPGEGILERSEGMQAVLREERRAWRMKCFLHLTAMYLRALWRRLL